MAGGEVLDDGVGAAVGDLEQAVDCGEAAGGAAAVDGGGLQLERGADAAAGAGRCRRPGSAALGADVIVERVVLQQQAGAGDGR